MIKGNQLKLMDIAFVCLQFINTIPEKKQGK